MTRNKKKGNARRLRAHSSLILPTAGRGKGAQIASPEEKKEGGSTSYSLFRTSTGERNRIDTQKGERKGGWKEGRYRNFLLYLSFQEEGKKKEGCARGKGREEGEREKDLRRPTLLLPEQKETK